jgi:hypothetical protein
MQYGHPQARPLSDWGSHWYTDPGEHKLAVSIAWKKELRSVGFVQAWGGPIHNPTGDITFHAIEKPQIYRTTATAQANDCLNVWGSACWFRTVVRLAGHPIHFEERILLPEVWKAQVDKPQHHDRIWQALTPEERRLFPPDTYTRIQRGIDRGGYTKSKGNEVHNLLDSTGIMLFCEGRTGRGGVLIRL